MVAKHKKSPYIASSSRTKYWIKIKKSETYSLFVDGFIRGTSDKGWENLVGALMFYALDLNNNKVHVAYCSSMTLEKRKAISIYDSDTDTVSLHLSEYGKVYEVEGQELTGRNFRLSHARIVSERFDIVYTDCLAPILKEK